MSQYFDRLPPGLSVPLAVLSVAVAWCFVSWVVGRIGGWHALATRFPAGPKRPVGVDLYYLQSLELSVSEYKGSAIVGIAPGGLYLSVIVLARAGHAPILIPWSAITGVKTEKRLWRTCYELSVPLEKFNTATITLFGSGLMAGIAPHLEHLAHLPRGQSAKIIQ